MKKNDIILVISIAVVAIACFVWLRSNQSKQEPDWVVVSVGNQVYGKYPLNQDATYEIHAHDGEENILEIKDGIVTMKEANCSDRICVYQSDISKNGEMIVCLPHQVIVVIEASEETEKDAVAN